MQGRFMAWFGGLTLDIQSHKRGPRIAEKSIKRYGRGCIGDPWPFAQEAGGQEGNHKALQPVVGKPDETAAQHNQWGLWNM